MWQPIETAPKDGTKILVWADGYEWPEVVLYEDYPPADQEEIGERGFWRYAEDLMADATESCDDDEWTHWQPLPEPPEA